MVVGCTALVVAAIMLPALLLTPPAKLAQVAKTPAPAPPTETSTPSPAEPTRPPPAAPRADPPLPRASEGNTQPAQAVKSPAVPARTAEPSESTGAVDPTAARPPARPADQAAKSPDQAAAVAASPTKDAAKPNEVAAETHAKAADDHTKPSDQAAGVPQAEVTPTAKAVAPAVALTENASNGSAGPSEQNAVRPPNDLTSGARTDLKMPTVEPAVPSNIGAPPEDITLPGKTAGLKQDEPAATGGAPEGVATPALPARPSVRPRTPWWCANPRGIDVAAVCGNNELLALDAELNTLYAKLMAHEQSAELRSAQRQWLLERQSCGADITCLKRHYQKRIDELARM